MMNALLTIVLTCPTCGTTVDVRPAAGSRGELEGVVLYHLTRLTDQLKTHLCLPTAPEHPTAPEPIG